MFDKHYAKYYDLFNREKPYKEEIDLVYKLADKPEWIFDIGPGTAVYWKYYPKKVKLFGVDRSPAMIEMADKSRGQIVCADIRDYAHNGKFECVTALFDVINYIPRHDWWGNLPLETGGYFLFDIWDKEKVDKDGFKKTVKVVDGATRTITLVSYENGKVTFELKIEDKETILKEMHWMYLYSQDDIKGFCGDSYEISDIVKTKSWQSWYKLKRK